MIIKLTKDTLVGKIARKAGEVLEVTHDHGIKDCEVIAEEGHSGSSISNQTAWIQATKKPLIVPKNESKNSKTMDRPKGENILGGSNDESISGI